MSRKAWAYIIAVIGLGLIMAVKTLSVPVSHNDGWVTFVFFAMLATFAQLFKVLGPAHEAYHINLTVLFAGILVLSPVQYILLVTIPHLIEWAKERLLRTQSLRNWYIQPFNIATHIIAGLSVYFLREALGVAGADPGAVLSVLVALLSAFVYAVLNQLLIGEAILLARRVSRRESGILDASNTVINYVLLLLGYTVAVVWHINPLLILPALSPLVLMYRALTIPKLTKQAQLDEKTGLFNARHFMTLYNAQIDRSQRTNSPLALLMVDIDLLRNINNTYGHLAGDAVLAGVARVIREGTRGADIPGRFGGEEFCVALPDTTPEQGIAIAERLRSGVEKTEFSAQALGKTIHATVSIGVACFPMDALMPFDLIHKADIAVYQAKLSGRNCVMNVAELPAILVNGVMPGGDRIQDTPSATHTQRPLSPSAAISTEASS